MDIREYGSGVSLLRFLRGDDISSYENFLKQLARSCFPGVPEELNDLVFVFGYQDAVYILTVDNTPVGAASRWQEQIEISPENLPKVFVSILHCGAAGILETHRGRGLYQLLLYATIDDFAPPIVSVSTQHPVVYRRVLNLSHRGFTVYPQYNRPTPKHILRLVRDIYKDEMEHSNFVALEPTLEETLVYRNSYEYPPYRESPYRGDRYFEEVLRLNKLDRVCVVAIRNEWHEIIEELHSVARLPKNAPAARGG